MIRRILFAILMAGGLLSVTGQSASAQWGYHHHYYRPYGYYGRPVYVAPPVVVAPPVGIVGYPPPPPAYIAPPVIAPAPLPPPPMVAQPAYVPSYTYGTIGPRGVGIGYATPGFGFYVGR